MHNEEKDRVSTQILPFALPPELPLLQLMCSAGVSSKTVRLCDAHPSFDNSLNLKEVMTFEATDYWHIQMEVIRAISLLVAEGLKVVVMVNIADFQSSLDYSQKHWLQSFWGILEELQTLLPNKLNAQLTSSSSTQSTPVEQTPSVLEFPPSLDRTRRSS